MVKPHTPPKSLLGVMAAYNIFGFQSCALKSRAQSHASSRGQSPDRSHDTSRDTSHDLLTQHWSRDMTSRSRRF